MKDNTSMTTTDNEDAELDWKKVANFPDYLITSTGIVRSQRKILKLYTNPYGYKVVGLHKNKKQYSCRVHRLVLQTFKPHSDNRLSACHKDGNKLNNNLNNLYWGTQKQNYADARRHGTASIMERHGSAKLTVPKVKAIRGRLKEGIPERIIAKEFNVHCSTINLISRRKIWKMI